MTITLKEHLAMEKQEALAKMAKDPTCFIGIPAQDLQHWHDYGIYTVAEYQRYMDEQCYINLHKDRYGVKPGRASMDAMSDEQLIKSIRRL